jgi:hypothetical protein
VSESEGEAVWREARGDGRAMTIIVRVSWIPFTSFVCAGFAGAGRGARSACEKNLLGRVDIVPELVDTLACQGGEDLREEWVGCGAGPTSGLGPNLASHGVG